MQQRHWVVFIDGKHCGTFGDIGIISFNGNKVLTTGGGGVLLTNSKKYLIVQSILVRPQK